MKPKSVLAGAALTLACISSTPASAAVVAFNGARANITPIVGVPGGSCGGQITVSIAPGALSSTGTSNFGGFSSTQSHCIAGAPPNPFTDGLFEYAFESGDTLFGTYTGVVTATATPGIFDAVENLVITGGTGSFLNATGALTSLGELSFGLAQGVRVSIFEGQITGSIDAPAIPEPESWALMVAGFGAAGATLRRRRRQDLTPSPGAA